MFDKTLFGDLEQRGSRNEDDKIISKLNTRVRTSSNKNKSLKDKMEWIRKEVNTHLSFLSDKVESCREEWRLEEYIGNLIRSGKGAIDTETTGLDYFRDKIYGWSSWVSGEKSIYVPMLHYGYVSGEKLDNQLNVDFVSMQLKRVRDNNVKLVYHNAKFDMHMIYHNFGVMLPVWWDTMIASRLLHSSEQDHSLKYQYNVKVKGGTEKPYDFKSLFEGVEANRVPIDIMTPYAAGDTFETIGLQEYQEKEFEKYPGIYNVFRNIEMPLLPIVVDMEETGVAIDKEFLHEMEMKYTKKLEESKSSCYIELEKYKDKINAYNIKNPNKLTDPINLSSPSQMAIVFYDIMGLEELQKYKRGTGKAVLDYYKSTNKFVEKLIDVRDAEKLLNGFIKAIPEYIQEDGRVHSEFVQIKGTANTNSEDEDTGADTGRFACIAEGQLVSTVNGDKPIEQIKVGDEVYCYDENGNKVISKVLNVFYNGFRECYWYMYDYKDELKSILCTPDHKVYYDGDWLAIDSVGKCRNDMFSYSEIKDRNGVPILTGVWDIEVEKHHNYFVNGVNVHNCRNPNLQQIPGRGEKSELRKMFVATDGYMMMSSDYSQQEPRLLSHCSGDREMQQAYKDGKDLYALMASKIYNLPYDECKEFRPDGTLNKEGKKRRSNVKSILLGLMYGRGAASIAEQTNTSVEEARELVNTFYNAFPSVKSWMTKVESDCAKNGYVETLMGRRRELPDALLPEYEFRNIGGKPKDYNPLDFLDKTQKELDYTVSEDIVAEYTEKLKKAYGFKARDEIIQEARREGIEIKDNSQYRAKAMRQSVNTVVQGSSADMSKLAMIYCATNEELNRLGFRMLFPVHDEIIAEAPIENAKRCGELMSQMMIKAANYICPSVPFKCDVEFMKRWNGEIYDFDENNQPYVKDEH